MHDKLKTGLILLLILNNIAFSQKSNSIQLFGNPFIQKIGNLNNQYTEISNEYIDVDYLKVASKELGIEFNHGFKNKLGYSIGFSWSNSGIKSITTWRHSEFPDYILDDQYKTLEYNSIGLRLGVSYHLMDRINLHGYLNFYLPYVEKKNTNWLSEYTVGSGQLFYYETKIFVGGTVGSIPDIIPDIRADFEIYPNLNFTLGMRLKFWDFLDDYTMRVEVTGYAGNENYGTEEILHLSKVNSTDFSYYFGLMYNLPLKKKIKLE